MAMVVVSGEVESSHDGGLNERINYESDLLLLVYPLGDPKEMQEWVELSRGNMVEAEWNDFVEE